MKKVNSLPENEEFFSNYIWLVKALSIAGYGGQVVSALTEIGGIYVAARLSLAPIIPAEFLVYICGTIAALGTAIIEVGLRHSVPHCVDSVLYRRFSGLRLAITVFVWLITGLLLIASGVLSFRNSTTIVSNMTQGEKLKDIAEADSIYTGKLETLDSIHRQEAATLDSTYKQISGAEAGALAAKVQIAERNLSNWKNRQWREKASLGTQIDAARLELTQAQAELAAATADITREKSQKLEALKARMEEKRQEAKAEHEAAIAQATESQAGKVAEYGGGLAYFTIICLVLLIVSITINRIVKKGSGVKEQVEITQYDLLPNPITAAWNAAGHRIRYILLNAITRFDEKTPDLNLPEGVREIYDPAEVKRQRAKLKLEEGEDSEYVIPRKRIRAFGDKEPKASITTDQPEHSFYEVNKRLRDYQKRLARHKQKAAKYERKGEAIPLRTQSAIDNNARWVEHWKAYKQRHYGT